MARKTEKGGKFRNVHCRTWNMARKLKIMENEKHPLDDLKNDDERTIFVPMIPESVFFKNQNDPRIRGLYAEMPILGGCTSTSCMNILHNQAMICIIKVSYWGAFPNSARLFCIYIIVALHIFPNFDFLSRP